MQGWEHIVTICALFINEYIFREVGGVLKLMLAEQCGWENKFVLDFSSSSPYGWGFSVEKKKSSDEMEAGMAILVEGAEHR